MIKQPESPEHSCIFNGRINGDDAKKSQDRAVWEADDISSIGHPFNMLSKNKLSQNGAEKSPFPVFNNSLKSLKYSI